MSVSFNMICESIIAPFEKDKFIKGLSLDSRAIQADWLFVALKGEKNHGLDFVKQAIDNGASMVLFEADGNLSADATKSFEIPMIEVADLSQHLSQIAARFYGQPSSQLRITAITGTNGKSSIAYGLAAIFDAHMGKTGVIGTVGFGMHDNLSANSHTTPNAIDTQKMLADLVQAKVKYLMMEASSHGLAQGRMSAVEVETAVFSNLSHDHLDFHPSIESYFEVKAKLFDFPTLSTAIVHSNDPYGRRLLAALPAHLRVIRYGIDIEPAGEHLSAEAIEVLPNGFTFTLKSSWGKVGIRLNLLGQFNIENALAMCAVYLTHGGSVDELPGIVEKIEPLNGRMQCFGGGDKPLVVVDFAHTPDALKKALSALRFHMSGAGKLHCVFGCGGNRDTSKRPMMAGVAEEGADFIIITDDNPRHEPSNQIIAEIIDGISDDSYVRIIPDRKEAIVDTVQKANQDDVVLVAGKGHEAYQMIGDVRHAFSDQSIVQEALC